MMKQMRFSALATVSFLSVLSLSACGVTGIPVVGKSVNSLAGQYDETEARLSTAAASAIAEGKTDEALVQYEKLYKKNRSNLEVAVNYAQLLRKTGKTENALAVLRPFMTQEDGKPRAKINPLVLNEFAAANISLGRFDPAEKTLNDVLEDSSAKDFHNDAYNLMGVALDAKGEHKEAEDMFRQALDGWKGDSTSVMNNLALSLANQGRFDESLTILREALIKAPDKQEIARNIRLVGGLRDSIVPKAPTNLKK